MRRRSGSLCNRADSHACAIGSVAIRSAYLSCGADWPVRTIRSPPIGVALRFAERIDAPERSDLSRYGLTAGHRLVIPLGGAGVDLPRAADALLRVLHHLLPLADPAHGARYGEQRSEHAGGETHRLEDDAGIEVDVRIQFPVHKVGVV